MSVKVYVFVECEYGSSFSVREEMEKIAGVESALTVTGPYDIIAYACASNFKVLGDVIIKKVQCIKGVKRTVTNVIIE